MNYDFKGKVFEERLQEISKHISKEDDVLDLGSGEEHILKFITPKSYLGMDIFEVYPNRTKVFDFNKKKYPDLDKKDYTMVASGLLEYLDHIPNFLTKIKKYGNKLILSYYEKDTKLDLWKNNYTIGDIVSMLNSTGWKITYSKKLTKTNQTIFVVTK